MEIGKCFLVPPEEFSGEQKEGTKAKDQWRVLILPAVMAGFGTGRYTMCDLDPVEVARLSGTRYGL